MPKENEGQTTQANVGSTIFLTHAALGMSLRSDIASIYWSIQFTRPPANQLVPVKPCVALTKSVLVPKGKAFFITIGK